MFVLVLVCFSLPSPCSGKPSGSPSGVYGLGEPAVDCVFVVFVRVLLLFSPRLPAEPAAPELHWDPSF